MSIPGRSASFPFLFREGRESQPQSCRVAFLTQACPFREGLEATAGAMLVKVKCSVAAFIPPHAAP